MADAYEAGVLANAVFSNNQQISAEAFRTLESLDQGFDANKGFSAGGMLDYVDRFYHDLEQAVQETPDFPNLYLNVDSSLGLDGLDGLTNGGPSLERVENASDEILNGYNSLDYPDPESDPVSQSVEQASRAVDDLEVKLKVRKPAKVKKPSVQKTQRTQESQEIQEIISEIAVAPSKSPEILEITSKLPTVKIAPGNHQVSDIIGIEIKGGLIREKQEKQEDSKNSKNKSINQYIRVQDALDVSWKRKPILKTTIQTKIETKIVEVAKAEIFKSPELSAISVNLAKKSELFLEYVDSGKMSLIPPKTLTIPKSLEHSASETEDILFLRDLADQLQMGYPEVPGVSSENSRSLAIAVELLALYQICWGTSVSYALSEHSEHEDVWTSAVAELFQIHALDMIWGILGEESEAWEMVFGEIRGAGLHSMAVRFGSDSIVEGEDLLKRLINPAVKILNMVE